MNKKAFLAIIVIAVLTSTGIAYGAARMIITMSPGQTEDPILIEDSSGTDLFVVDRFGKITGLKTAFVAKTSAYTATPQDDTIVVSASSASVTITLPSSASNAGKIFTIVKNDTTTNLVIVDPAGTETIDSESTFRITHTDDYVTIKSNGTDWNKISQSSSDSPSAFAIRGTAADRFVGIGITAGSQVAASDRFGLEAYPFIVSKTIKIDRIQITVSTASGGNTCRMGIYTDDGNAYPSTLVANSDVGTVDVGTSGPKSNTFASPITLPGNSLYWLAYQCSVRTTNLLNGLATASVPNILGSSGSVAGSPATGYNATNTYGAFPSPYPAGASMITRNPPDIGVRIIG